MRLKNTQTYFSLLIVYCLACCSCYQNQPFNYDCGPEIELDIEVKDFHYCLMDYGHIRLKPITGKPPYTYFWSNGDDNPFSKPISTSIWYEEYTTQNRYGLWYGRYFVTVTDAEGGYTTKEIEVIRDREINFIVDEKSNTKKEGSCDGSVKITPQGKDAQKDSVSYIIVGPSNYGNLLKTPSGVNLKGLCQGKYRLSARKDSYCYGELDFTIE